VRGDSNAAFEAYRKEQQSSHALRNASGTGQSDGLSPRKAQAKLKTIGEIRFSPAKAKNCRPFWSRVFLSASGWSDRCLNGLRHLGRRCVSSNRAAVTQRKNHLWPDFIIFKGPLARYRLHRPCRRHAPALHLIATKGKFIPLFSETRTIPFPVHAVGRGSAMPLIALSRSKAIHPAATSAFLFQCGAVPVQHSQTSAERHQQDECPSTDSPMAIFQYGDRAIISTAAECVSLCAIEFIGYQICNVAVDENSP